MTQLCSLLGRQMTDSDATDTEKKDLFFKVNYSYKGERFDKAHDDISFDVNYSYGCFALDDELFEYDHSFSAKAKNQAGQTLGIVMFNIKPDKTVYLDQIEVDKKFKRQGVGTKLLEFVEYVAKEFGANRIEGIHRKSAENILFYAKNGYEMFKKGDSNFVRKNLDLNKSYDNFVVSNVERVKPFDINVLKDE